MKLRKKKNVTDRFREFWSKLSSEEKRDLYPLLAILRGPDYTPDTNGKTQEVKMLSTGIVRRLLFGEEDPDIRKYVQISDNPLTMKSFARAYYLWNLCDGKEHFVRHIFDAVRSLRSLKLISGWISDYKEGVKDNKDKDWSFRNTFKCKRKREEERERENTRSRME